ncbi:glycosyl transferase family 2 [Pseudonocardia sediminis]|uniref:Glycosyl transferase family 2 n=1 Tax=Pseudonocardia sediminis TaxID=1397368 RepID=A0A4Q7V188_PSEST|nr:glycosyltransferase family 2 protein [Pseudonocardia sediminis]RZT86319.1 glycosyl transferase family 2 [Pseudonocardia sediminis]
MIVPTRNEARNLEVVLPAVAAVRPAVHEVIVVDGNSKDGTVDTARRVLPDVRIVMQTRKGKGNAMACGFAAATGDVVVMFDADGSADPAEIPAFVQALIDGADFAKGSRFVRGGGSDDITLLRKGGNYGLNGVANALFGTRYTDLCYGYNAFWSDVLPLLDLPEVDLPPRADGTMHWGDGFEIETVLNCRVAAAGLAITEVPSMERERMFGQTNLRTFADGTRVLRTLASERKRANRTAMPVPPAASPSTPAPTAVPQAEASAPVNGRRYVEPPTVQTTLPSTASVPPVAHEGNGARPMTPSPTPRAHRPQENGHRPTGTDGAARSDAVGVRYAWGEEAS